MTPTVEFKSVYAMDFESLEGMAASPTPKECEVTDDAAAEKGAVLDWLRWHLSDVRTANADHH
jgi:hypothetical protein